MPLPTLTPAGRAYALTHPESILACVALTGSETGWPDNYISAAIETMNDAGAGNDYARRIAADEEAER